MSRHLIFLVFFLSFFSQQLAAIGAEALLPPEQAFKVSAKAISPEQIELNWDIHEGYYLYRDKMAFESQTPAIEPGSAELPSGKVKHDEFFGDSEIYRGQLTAALPLNANHGQSALKLLVKYQGCADIGVCYPPQKAVLAIALPKPETSAKKGIAQLFDDLKLNPFETELLPAEQAFQFFAEVKDAHTLHVNWQIADGYYLYRDKIRFDTGNGDTTLGAYQIPPGDPYHDQEFGQVEIYHGELAFDVPLLRQDKAPQSLQLTTYYQGCAERGVCYPPMQKTLTLPLPAAEELAPTIDVAPEQALSEQDQIVNALKHDTLWLTLLSFFGFGLLLAFTPCVFPMIPILSGIIVGHGKVITTTKAFLLSLSYVLASALTYTAFGILAALFGSNLQAIFQEPWVIAVFSGIFILLSLSMFGFYTLEMPQAVQNRLHQSSNKHSGGSYIGAFIMGSLSSLIVGPCVAAPLAAALVYIGQTGDVVLGGSALFVMGLGMGMPLLLLGASAGKLLPRAGTWLNTTKSVFGVIMLAVAVWMLDRILPASITMLLWAMLLIIPAIYLSAIDPLPHDVSNWRKLWKGLGLIMLVYGILLLIGVSAGNHNPLQPLKGITSASAAERSEGLKFQRIKTLADLDRHLQQAGVDGRFVMLDFYADWCISCKEMEAYTFSAPAIKRQLADFVLLQADVTANDAADQALLKRFNLIGPPGIMFFDPNGQEIVNARVIGYQDSETFGKTLQKL